MVSVVLGSNYHRLWSEYQGADLTGVKDNFLLDIPNMAVMSSASEESSGVPGHHRKAPTAADVYADGITRVLRGIASRLIGSVGCRSALTGFEYKK